MAELVVNDLFVELREENERLLNELMVSQKCIELMQNYRNCLNSFNTNCICDQNSDQNKQTLNALEVKYKSIETEIKGIVKLIEENRRRRSAEKGSELALNSNKSRNNSKRQKSSEVMSEEEVVDEEDEENELESESQNTDKPNVKFMSKSDYLLEEEGNVITKRDDKNGLILVVKSNDKNEQIFGYRCNWSDCQFVSVSKPKIKDHLRSVHNLKGRLVCLKCKQTFLSQKLLTQHQSDEHSNQFRCDVDDCDFTTKHRKNLNEHLRRHSGVKPYPCTTDDCGKRFTTRQELRRHTNSVHLGIKYVCEWPGCQLTFKNNKSLENHKSGHF